MKKEIIVNCSQEETRVAILDNGVMTDLFIERFESEKIVGNIYKGKVEALLSGISSAFINVGLGKNVYLNGNDVVSETGERKIEKILSKGTEVMVQVDKEPISTKGAKVTMDISLPGRFLVYMPLSDHSGISKNIDDREERHRLKEITHDVKPETGGIIVRTEAEEATKDELKREMKYLQRLWGSIKKQFETRKSPALLHRDLGVVFQTIRDYFNEDVEILLIDSKKEYADCLEFVNIVSPELAGKVKHYSGKTPIFKAFGIEEAIKKLHFSRVNLASGGSIIIQEAESLCAVDVNTGKFKGSSGNQEETVTQNNIEAAKEIARQLRLRNIGGIIVIDFIDMKHAKNRQRVLHALEEAVKGDKAKIKILPITRLGLVEMTRERKRESLFSLVGETCPNCNGTGAVISRESLFIQICNELEQLKAHRHAGKIRLRLHPPVASYFKERQSRLNKAVGNAVEIQQSEDIDWDDYQIIIE